MKKYNPLIILYFVIIAFIIIIMIGFPYLIDIYKSKLVLIEELTGILSYFIIIIGLIIIGIIFNEIKDEIFSDTNTYNTLIKEIKEFNNRLDIAEDNIKLLTYNTKNDNTELKSYCKDEFKNIHNSLNNLERRINEFMITM